jgi:hypothetical protein
MNINKIKELRKLLRYTQVALKEIEKFKKENKEKIKKMKIQ